MLWFSGYEERQNQWRGGHFENEDNIRRREKGPCGIPYQVYTSPSHWWQVVSKTCTCWPKHLYQSSGWWKTDNLNFVIFSAETRTWYNLVIVVASYFVDKLKFRMIACDLHCKFFFFQVHLPNLWFYTLSVWFHRKYNTFSVHEGVSVKVKDIFDL